MRIRNQPAWGREATLGIFVHWGPYSVSAWAEPTGEWGAVPEDVWFAHNAYAEWYANTIRIAGSPASEYHKAVFGDEPYIGLLDRWRAEAYDPRDWAALFAAVGADYVIPVTKHHDGVALWDAPGAGPLSTVGRGPRRDLITPLADAVRAAGMRFGVYYSGGLDWSYAEQPPIESFEAIEVLRPVDDGYARYATGHVMDLIERYRPSVIWNDINWPDAGKADGSLDRLLDHYRELVPDGIVNDRWGAEVWDFRTSEYEYGRHNESGDGWEHSRGIGLSFGFNRVEDPSLSMRPHEIARLYADVVSRGGRLLLNVGPEDSGRIPPVQRLALEGVGPWLRDIKPLTRSRSMLPDGAITVHGASWWRAWQSNRQAVVVLDGSPDRITVESSIPAVAVPLPSA
jgi:alpha-L-fucosidase